MEIILNDTQLEGYNPEIQQPDFQGGRVISFNCDGSGNALIMLPEANVPITMHWNELYTILQTGWYSVQLPEQGNLVDVNERFDIVLVTNNDNSIDDNMELIDLSNNPRLRALLIAYISTQYEEFADFSEESLWAEYQRLKRDGELNALFIQEALDNCRF